MLRQTASIVLYNSEEQSHVSFSQRKNRLPISSLYPETYFVINLNGQGICAITSLTTQSRRGKSLAPPTEHKHLTMTDLFTEHGVVYVSVCVVEEDGCDLNEGTHCFYKRFLPFPIVLVHLNSE